MKQQQLSHAELLERLRAVFPKTEGFEIDADTGSDLEDEDGDEDEEEVCYYSVNETVSEEDKNKGEIGDNCLMIQLHRRRNVIELRELHRLKSHRVTGAAVSGAALLKRLDEFAESVGVRAIVLTDEAITTCGFSYSNFLVLATGESYYNMFGYRRRKTDAKDRAHNAALISRPFARVVHWLYYKKPLEIDQGDPAFDRLMERALGGCAPPACLAKLGVSYANTTQELFGAIHRANILHDIDDCDNDPRAKWIEAVLDLFAPAIRGDPEVALVKTFDVAKGGGRPRPRPRPYRRRRTVRRANRKTTVFKASSTRKKSLRAPLR